MIIVDHSCRALNMRNSLGISRSACSASYCICIIHARCISGPRSYSPNQGVWVTWELSACWNLISYTKTFASSMHRCYFRSTMISGSHPSYVYQLGLWIFKRALLYISSMAVWGRRSSTIVRDRVKRTHTWICVLDRHDSSITSGFWRGVQKLRVLLRVTARRGKHSSARLNVPLSIPKKCNGSGIHWNFENNARKPQIQIL